MKWNRRLRGFKVSGEALLSRLNVTLQLMKEFIRFCAWELIMCGITAFEAQGPDELLAIGTGFGGTEFSVANNGQFIAFVLQASIKRCNHYFQTFRFIIFPMFVLNFGVESLEQTVKLGRLVVFDFRGNFLLQTPLLPNWQPKSSAFYRVFIYRDVFQLLYCSCGSGRKPT